MRPNVQLAGLLVAASSPSPVASPAGSPVAAAGATAGDMTPRVVAAGQRTQRLLPLGSAIVVTALGAAITAKAVLTYLSS